MLKDNSVEETVMIGAMSHMCAVTIHEACVTHDLEFDVVTAPAAQVHAALMAALAFLMAR